MRRQKLFFSVFLSLIINISFIASCMAGLRIDSPKVRLSILPGGYDSGEIKVENTGDMPITVSVYLEDWVYSEQDGGKTFMPKGTHAFSGANWINFYPADFTVAAKASEVVRYTVNVPQEAKGGHYCVLFFETGADDFETPGEGGTRVRVKVLNRVGALFYIEPKGTIKKTAEIQKLNLTEKLNDFIVTATLINTGNTDITATGTFNVIDKEGFVYLRGSFDEVYTLPGDSASLRSVVSSSNLKPGTYDILLTLDFQNGGSLVHEASFRVSGEGIISQ